MDIRLQRRRHNNNTTIGVISDGFIKMVTLEDEPRDIKIKGKTRIPAGRYEIKERKVLSPKTEKYRKRFKWFKWHLELQDVPNFKYVYVHIGNSESDTDGCILTGEEVSDWKIIKSTIAFRRFYHYVMGAINSGQKVYLDIHDEI